MTQINTALGQPPFSDNNYQTEASTENIIGDNNNQLVNGSQPNNQPTDSGSDSPFVNSHKRSQRPKVSMI